MRECAFSAVSTSLYSYVQKVFWTLTSASLILFAFMTASYAAGSSSPVSDESFIELDTISLPVFGKRGQATTLMFKLIAEVNDPDAAEKIRSLKPRLNDAYIRVLYDAVHSRRVITKEGYLDLPTVKNKLLRVSYKVTELGPADGFTDLLIRNVHHSRF